jgi:hypothetical protein
MARTTRTQRAPQTGTEAPKRATAIERAPDLSDVPSLIDQDQQRRMAECCAYFSAERFRPAAPGTLRECDIVAAEQAIAAAVQANVAAALQASSATEGQQEA